MSSSSDGEQEAAAPLPPVTLALSAEQTAELFPFHIVLDEALAVVQTGAALARILPEVKAGRALGDFFEIERPCVPIEFSALQQHSRMLFILKRLDSKFRLRGQMLALPNEGRIVFLGSPWLPEPGGFRLTGLRIEDFPVFDAMPELVQVVQSQRLAVEDLQKLTTQLKKQRQELRNANEKLLAKEAQSRHLAAIAARTENTVVVTDPDGRVQWVNESFEKLTGYTLEEALGKRPGTILQGPQTDPATVRFMKEKLEAGESFQCDVINYHKSGRKYWVSIEVQPMHDEHGNITNFMAMESDVSKRKEWEIRSRLAYSVTKVLAESLDVDAALEQILRLMCETIGYRVAAIWRMEPSSEQLYVQNFWASGELIGFLYEYVTKAFRLKPGTGLPGMVWRQDAPIWWPLNEDIQFPRKTAAIQFGLKSCLAFPIRIAGGVRGVMEFFSDAVDEPSKDLLETLMGLGSQIEQFIERREAEQERANILSLLDSTLESTSEGILVTDREGVPLRANRRWFDLWKVPKEQRKDLNRDVLFGLINPQLKDSATFEAIQASHNENPIETRSEVLTLLDGRVLEVLSTPHRIGSQIVGRVWTYRDITQSHREQSEREGILAMLNATMESTADGIMVADLNGTISNFNQRFVEIWGFPQQMRDHKPAEGLRPYAAKQLCHPMAFTSRIEWLYKHPEESSYDVVHFLDGRVYERYSQPQRIGEQIIGRVWSYRDVTERWRAGEALRESEERYRVVAETASDVILTVDVTGTILFANASAARVFGWTAEELQGRSILELMPERLRVEQREVMAQYLEKGLRSIGWQGIELTGLRRDGREFALEVSLGESVHSGKRVFAGIIRDISQRKAAEEQLQQAIREAENANQAKSDFLANMSHEIRTPLNSILGWSALLRTTRLDAEQQEMLNSVYTSSESLLHLINDLLDFSKIEAGQVDIEASRFDPAEICEQAVDNLRVRAARKNLAIYFIADKAVPKMLIGDAKRIRQVLINLLGNAVKFTERGSITLRLQAKPAADGKAELCFGVEDTGIGISKESQAKIFGRFSRIDTALGRKEGGAGLGLSISRLLCEAMGGTMDLESETSKGSRFRFHLTLPCVETPAAPTSEARPLRALLLGRQDQLELQRETLAASGLEVDAFDDIAAALSHADHFGPYDLFIGDEDCSSTPDGVRMLARVAVLGTELRSILIMRTPAAGRNAQSLPGRSEELEFPLTPVRIERALGLLMANTTAAEESPADSTPQSKAVTQRGARVLLVEDNPDGQAYARRVLERGGAEVTIAATGAEVQEAFSSNTFDVILMDVMLPDMTGFDATRSIRNLEQSSGRRRTPIVALTAHALLHYRHEAFDAGMDDYLTKPVHPQALLDAVQKWGPKQSESKPPVAVQKPAVSTAEEIEVDEDLADLIPGYLEAIVLKLRQIHRHCESGKLKEAAGVAHSVAGTGGSYGFPRITELGRKIETAAQEGDAQLSTALTSELETWLANMKWKVAD